MSKQSGLPRPSTGGVVQNKGRCLNMKYDAVQPNGNTYEVVALHAPSAVVSVRCSSLGKVRAVASAMLDKVCVRCEQPPKG